MKERPILFNGDMVRAILDGRKTQTRRIAKIESPKNPDWYPDRYNKTEDWCFWGARGSLDSGKCTTDWFRCPYGKVGDQLWVRETCQATQDGMTFGVNYLADNHTRWLCRSRDTDWLTMYDYRGASGATIPSIHMPRWASRIQLEITGVRVERLNDITETDAIAEGFDLAEAEGQGWKFKARHNFKSTWDRIYQNWQENPWVWVVEFKVVKP